MKPVIYKKWELYKPQVTEENLFEISKGVNYFKDESDNDWYELRDELSVKYKEHYFLITNMKTNIIESVSTDVNFCVPVNGNLVIVDSIPDGLREMPHYFRFENDKIVPDNTYKINALTDYINEELMWASSQISALNDIEEFGTPTEEEKERLLALRKYRFTLTRVVPEDNPDIDLPDRP
ncbi:tail fiber assembly protein [Salmonella phage SE_PL]|uniref:tail fiber assembly protein n=1 Tax=Salmonella enterica TaxID=28901 RepID=UPI001163694D|nr:putative tail fiber chaperone [Salmonella phage 7t3]QIG62752.1 tail fiber assembly protein [Salmonella phage SE_PL]